MLFLYIAVVESLFYDREYSYIMQVSLRFHNIYSDPKLITKETGNL